MFDVCRFFNARGILVVSVCTYVYLLYDPVGVFGYGRFLKQKRDGCNIMVLAMVPGVLSTVLRCPYVVTNENRIVSRLMSVLVCVGRIHCFFS